MLHHTISPFLLLCLVMIWRCFAETSDVESSGQILHSVPEDEIVDTINTKAKKILKVTWRHNLNNVPFKGYMDKSKWEYRTEELSVVDSYSDNLSISYSFAWVYQWGVYGDIFPHAFEINEKHFHIIPSHPEHKQHYADFFDLLAKIRMKYELKELPDSTSPVGLLYIETEEMNFSFIYEEENGFFINFYEDARLIVGKNQCIEIVCNKKIKMEISESYYHYLIYFSYIWDSPSWRIP